MDHLTGRVLALVALLLSIGFPVWAIWMIRRHLAKKDPEEKHRRTETLMMRPFLFAGLGVAAMPIMGLLVFYAVIHDQAQRGDAIWTLVITLAVSVFFVLYGTRWILIYDYDGIRYRPIIGKLRNYSFGEIRSMTPIAFDLLIHVGRRWILIDAQQDWHPLLEKYQLWKIRNGIPIKKKEYKTAVGRAFGEIHGGISILIALIIFFSFCAACFLLGMWMALQAGKTLPAIGFLLFAVLCGVSLTAIMFAAANQEKYPRFAKFILGDQKKWGKPRQGKEKKTEKESDRPKGR